MAADAVEVETNSPSDSNKFEGDDQRHVPDESDHATASLKCLETLTHLIREGSKWWAFKHWAELLPGRRSLEKNAKRALMERQAIEILKKTKPGERQLDQLEFLSRYLKHCAKKFFSQVSDKDMHLLCQRSKLDYMKTGRRIVFEQGDRGKYFYIVIRGRVLIYVSDWDISHLDRDSKQKNPSLLGSKVAEILAGGTFGEIAMSRKNGKRMASALAVFGTGLLKVDAETYNIALKASRDEARQLENHLTFLGQMPCFEGFTRLRLVHIAYEMKSRDVSYGRYIQHQGKFANGVYLITRGQVDVSCMQGKSRVRIGTWRKPRILGLRTLFAVHSQGRKVTMPYGKEKFDVMVSSTYVSVIFLPFDKLKSFLDRLKGTKALSAFAAMIEEEEEELALQMSAHNHAVSALNASKYGKLQESYLENTNHGYMKKVRMQFPSPAKHERYNPQKYRRMFATVEQVDATISLDNAIQNLREKANTLPSFSAILANAKIKNTIASQEKNDRLLLGPPGMHQSEYDTQRSRYLKEKRSRWLKSSNLKTKRMKWKKQFKKLARDEFDLDTLSGRILYDSHGRIIAQMKS